MTAWFFSWMPSWAPTFGSGGLALFGVGLLVYSVLPFCKLPRLAAAAGIVALAASCFLAGVGSAQAVCEADKLAAELRSQLAAERQRTVNLERDLTAARDAQKATSAARAAAEAEAATQRERADEYEADLARRPERACPLDDADVRGLLNLQRRN